jgi:uncharacterized metal-binding protein
MEGSASIPYERGEEGWMPSGRVHAKVATGLAAVGSGGLLAAAFMGMHPVVTLGRAAAVSAGLVMGILITPDIDLTGVTYEERRIQRWFGVAAKRGWMLFWRQYARGIQHRCALSHAPVRSTLIRVAYMWPIWVAIWLVWPDVPWALAPWALIGWSVQDSTHTLLDQTPLGRLVDRKGGSR